MLTLNETHDANLSSWVDSANNSSDFPIQNLPLAVFRRSGSDEPFRVGVAIGDQVLDLAGVAQSDALTVNNLCDRALATCGDDTLNRLMALGLPHWSALRLTLSRALRRDAAEQAALTRWLVPMAAVGIPSALPDW